jgi:hypothetical protein
MSRKPSSGLSGIDELGLLDKGQNKIIDRSHHFSSVADGHPSSIFFESDIAAIMQVCFDALSIADCAKQETKGEDKRDAQSGKSYHLRDDK